VRACPFCLFLVTEPAEVLRKGTPKLNNHQIFSKSAKNHIKTLAFYHSTWRNNNQQKKLILANQLFK
jgi:hypothetical protein